MSEYSAPTGDGRDDEPPQPMAGSETPTPEARSPLFAPLFRALRPASTYLSSFFAFATRTWSAGMKWVLARSLQGFERLFLRSHVVRGSTRLTLSQSARVAASTNRDSSKMSAGASINIAEVVDIIDTALAGGMHEGAAAP